MLAGAWSVLKGMIPAYERGQDLLGTVKIGSMDALMKAQLYSRVFDPARAGPFNFVQGRLRLPPNGRPQSPDALNSVQERVASMPPYCSGKDIAEELGATPNSTVLVTSPQGELTPFGLVPK